MADDRDPERERPAQPRRSSAPRNSAGAGKPLHVKPHHGVRAGPLGVRARPVRRAEREAPIGRAALSADPSAGKAAVGCVGLVRAPAVAPRRIRSPRLGSSIANGGQTRIAKSALASASG